MAVSKTERNRNSKPVRLSHKNLKALAKFKEPEESWDTALGHLVSDSLQLWALPSDLFTTKAKAKGEALKRAARHNLDLDQVDGPVRVARL